MLYGAIKLKSYPGLFAAALVLFVPVIIYNIETLPTNYVIAEWSKTIFTTNNFHFLNSNIASVFGIGDGTAFYFYEKPFLKIQTFLAFAYTYHYLNWFSKTSIIGWHKMLSKRNSIIVAVAWIVSVLLYLIDYRTGFILLVFLSTLHVFLEFPLNMVSIKGIGEEIKKRL